MVKTANVVLPARSYRRRLRHITVRGDVGAVKAATEAGLLQRGAWANW